MANRTISENINQAISDFKGIKQALIDKGVEMPQGTPTSEYGAKIEGMTVGGLDTSGITDFSSFCEKNRIPVDDLDGLDTRSGTNFTQMFYQCTNLTTVPQLDLRNGTNFYHMFSGCINLTTVPQLDTSKGTNFTQMFYGCRKLKAVELDTSNGTNFGFIFYECRELKAVELDTSNGTNFGGMFSGCYNLSTVKLTSFVAHANMFGSCSALTNLTVTGTITVNATNALKLDYSSKLTVESLLSVLNALKDNTGGTTYNIQLGSTNLAKLTEEQKAIATNKNYTLS